MYDKLIMQLRGCADAFFCVSDCPKDPDTNCQEQLMKEAADAIEALSKKEKTAQWIPVTERLPENEVPVLVVRRFLGVKDCPPKTYVEVAEYCYGDWVADSDEYKIARSKHTDPLYWMPLPEPPKEETK